MTARVDIGVAGCVCADFLYGLLFLEFLLSQSHSKWFRCSLFRMMMIGDDDDDRDDDDRDDDDRHHKRCGHGLDCFGWYHRGIVVVFVCFVPAYCDIKLICRKKLLLLP